uniref:Cytochrome b561 domain-containing protein n=1 Tax=Cucumis sativus TaxID=3659 RepID=A0A0A0KLE5_CUCSA
MVLWGHAAIMAYKSIPGRKYWRKVVHLVLHLMALACGIFGVCMAFKFHHEIKLSDLLSLHSWIGLIAVSLYAFQWIFGFFVYFFPGAEARRRGNMLPWHVYFGVFIFLIATCNAELGLLQRFNTLVLGHSQQGLIVNFTGLLLLLYAATVVLTVILPPLY